MQTTTIETSTVPTRKQARKPRQTKRSGPALKNVAPATWLVTVAVDEARKTGYMSRRDAQRMSHAEYNSYVALCEREWGVTQWDQNDS